MRLLSNEQSTRLDKLQNLGHLSVTSPEWLVASAWIWAVLFDYFSKSSHMQNFLEYQKTNRLFSFSFWSANKCVNNQVTLACCHFQSQLFGNDEGFQTSVSSYEKSGLLCICAFHRKIHTGIFNRRSIEYLTICAIYITQFQVEKKYKTREYCLFLFTKFLLLPFFIHSSGC